MFNRSIDSRDRLARRIRIYRRHYRRVAISAGREILSVSICPSLRWAACAFLLIYYTRIVL